MPTFIGNYLYEKILDTDCLVPEIMMTNKFCSLTGQEHILVD